MILDKELRAVHSVVMKRNTFWDIFAAVNILALVVFLLAEGWALFDIHNRIQYAVIAQIPAIVLLVTRRLLK